MAQPPGARARIWLRARAHICHLLHASRTAGCWLARHVAQLQRVGGRCGGAARLSRPGRATASAPLRENGNTFGDGSQPRVRLARQALLVVVPEVRQRQPLPLRRGQPRVLPVVALVGVVLAERHELVEDRAPLAVLARPGDGGVRELLGELQFREIRERQEEQRGGLDARTMMASPARAGTVVTGTSGPHGGSCQPSWLGRS